jgi:hypothetical protein
MDCFAPLAMTSLPQPSKENERQEHIGPQEQAHEAADDKDVLDHVKSPQIDRDNEARRNLVAIQPVTQGTLRNPRKRTRPPRTGWPFSA